MFLNKSINLTATRFKPDAIYCSVILPALGLFIGLLVLFGINTSSAFHID